MTRHLKQEVSVSALMEKFPWPRSFDRQAAQDEGSRREAKSLLRSGAAAANHLDRVSLTHSALRDTEIRANLREDGAGGFEACTTGAVSLREVRMRHQIPPPAVLQYPVAVVLEARWSVPVTVPVEADTPHRLSTRLVNGISALPRPDAPNLDS